MIRTQACIQKKYTMQSNDHFKQSVIGFFHLHSAGIFVHLHCLRKITTHLLSLAIVTNIYNYLCAQFIDITLITLKGTL